MKWFRRHIKTGSRLALFALAIQFALSFGHFHVDAARAAPAMQIGLTDADLSYVAACAGQAAGEAGAAAARRSRYRSPPGRNCAICAVLSLASNLLFAHPPLLLLPQAIELLYLVTDAEFAHLNSGRLGVPVPRATRFLTSIDRRLLRDRHVTRGSPPEG